MRNPVFLACLLLYAAFRLVLWLFPGLLPPFLIYYLPDFLCLPLVLTLVLVLQRHVVLRQPAYTLNAWQVVFAVGYFSVLFEVVFPRYYSRYTSDVADALAYALGGILYWYGINPRPVPAANGQ